MYSIKEKVRRVKKIFHGFICTKEIEKMYRGEPYKVNRSIKRLRKKSIQYCKTYSKYCSIPEDKLTRFQKWYKELILDRLFLGHGRLFGVGGGIETTIGMVDLGDNIYINCNVKFGNNTLCEIGNYFICAPSVVIGKDSISDNDIPSMVAIEDDVWLCAKSTVGVLGDNQGLTRVERRSVIGLSNSVKCGEIFPAEHILKSHRKESIDKVYNGDGKRVKVCEDIKKQTEYKRNVDELIAHLKTLGVNGDFQEYIKLLKGEDYNSLEPTVSKINSLSHQLSSKYNREKSEQKKRHLLRLLFPGSGTVSNLPQNIFVDTIGAVTLGNSVTIGDNVSFLGNVVIPDNCVIEEGVLFAGTGHKIYYADRHITVDNKGNPCEMNTGGFIIVQKRVVTKADEKKMIGYSILR